MREETQPKPKICVHCRRPITPEQRPAVLLPNGDEVHIECWNDYKQHEGKPSSKPN